MGFERLLARELGFDMTGFFVPAAVEALWAAMLSFARADDEAVGAVSLEKILPVGRVTGARPDGAALADSAVEAAFLALAEEAVDFVVEMVERACFFAGGGRWAGAAVALADDTVCTPGWLVDLQPVLAVVEIGCALFVETDRPAAAPRDCANAAVPSFALSPMFCVEGILRISCS